MKKSAIVVATLLALSAGAANADVLNGFTGKVEAEHTTQDKSTNLEARIGYDFNFGAVSVIPFASVETQYEDKRFNDGSFGGGLRVQTNFDNFYAYAEGRAMRKDRIKVYGATPMDITGNGAEVIVDSTVKEYRAEVGTGYQFDSGLFAGVEASYTRDRFEGVNSNTRNVFAVAGYEFIDNLAAYVKVGREDSGELAVPYANDATKWETKSVIGLTYRF
ncbi:porin family protein [Shewanella spartinae]|uniref:porin family protein n=1 Tax=Shewanella spartinae TaxID=2864205 RepID=UPI001C6568E9|nr:porin family protein [Shewanella spartinae]QYJ93779.1 porin family protein [Shewanella spartinae]